MPEPRYRLITPLTVAWRDDGVLQVGLDAEASAVLAGAPPGAELALRALHRWQTVAEVAALVPGMDAAWLRRALPALVAHGVLRTRRVDPAPLVVVGDGPLARAVSRVASAHEGLRTVEVPGAAGVDAAGPGAGPVLVCPRTIEPDRGLTRALVRARRPHLLVRCEPERVVVGPFVVPGRSACARCADLVRCDLDSSWPRLLAQLCRMEIVPPDGPAAWAAATAVGQVLAWVGGRLPETMGASLELDAATHALASRRWPAHPDCGCALAVA